MIPRSDLGGGGGAHLLEEFNSKVTYLCRNVKGEMKLKKHTQVWLGGDICWKNLAAK